MSPATAEAAGALPRWPLSSTSRLAAVVLVVAFGVAVYSPLVGGTVLVLLVVTGFVMGGRSELSALIIFVLLLYVMSPRLTFRAFQITPALVVALGLGFLWLAGRIADHGPWLPSPIGWALFGFGLVMALTYGLGLSQPLLARQLEGADSALIRTVAWLGVAVFTIDLIRTREHLRRTMTLIVGGVTLMSMAAVVQRAFSLDVVQYMRLPGLGDKGILQTGVQQRLGQTRASGTASHPIELAVAIGMVLPFALHLRQFARTPRQRSVLNWCLMMMASAAVVSLSRSAFLTIAVVLVLLVPTWPSSRRFRFGVTLAALAMGAWLVFPSTVSSSFELLSNWSGESIEGANLAGRTDDYVQVRTLVLDSPWFGTGLGTHVAAISFATDNQYLDLIIETGIVGVGALALLLGVSWGQLRRARRTKRSAQERDLLQSCAAAVAAAAVSLASFDAFAFDIAAGTMFLVFGLAGAAVKLATFDETHVVEPIVIEPGAVEPGGDADRPLAPTPGITVVIPTYNRADLMARALYSVFTQSVQPVAVIVVDDGSTDRTRAIIEQYPPVTYVYQENAGAAAARNRGLELAPTRWVAFLDSDDYWLSGHLERLTAAMEATEGSAAVYFSDLLRPPTESSDSQWVRSGFAIRGPHEVVSTAWALAIKPRLPMMLQASMVDRDVVLAAGGLREHLSVREDTDLFIRLCLNHRVCAVAGRGAQMTASDDPSNRLRTNGPGSTSFERQSIRMYRDLIGECHHHPDLPTSVRGVFNHRLMRSHIMVAKNQARRGWVVGFVHHLAAAAIADPAGTWKSLRRRVGRDADRA